MKKYLLVCSFMIVTPFLSTNSYAKTRVWLPLCQAATKGCGAPTEVVARDGCPSGTPTPDGCNVDIACDRSDNECFTTGYDCDGGWYVDINDKAGWRPPVNGDENVYRVGMNPETKFIDAIILIKSWDKHSQ